MRLPRPSPTARPTPRAASRGSPRATDGRAPPRARALRRGAAALLASAALACGPDAATAGPAGGAPAARPLFEDVTEVAGLDVPLTCGGAPFVKTSILEVNGTGAALLDVDGDDDLDVLLVDGTTHAGLLAGEPVALHLLLNTGVVDGVPRFERATDTGLVMTGWPAGVAYGDVDRDGRPDLVVGGHGEDALFLNRTEDGAPRFEKHPLPGRRGPLDWTTSVGLADADGDGILDLVLVRYLELDPADVPVDDVGGVPCRFEGHPVLCGPHGLPPQPDVFLRGLPGPPWFEDATAAVGLDAPPAYGLGLLFTDLDTDGDVDLYVANDSVDNHLYRNDGAGRFEEVGAMSGAAADMAGRAQAGMGVATADYDRDGDLDLVVTNFSAEANTLYRGDGPLTFRDVSAAAGLSAASRPLLGWGVLLADLDADGLDDLLFSNGHVYPEADAPGTTSSYAQPMVMLPGRPDGRFGGNAFPDARRHRGRAAVAGDLDDDGDLDLLVLRLDDTPRLFLNRTDAPGRQTLVLVRGDATTGTDAVGATLLLDTDRGRRALVVTGASSFQSQGDRRLHLALRPGETLRAAEVRWPGGGVEALDPDTLRPGREVLVERGAGATVRRPLETRP